MRAKRLMAVAACGVTIAAAVSISTHKARAQDEALLAPVYNPYPPGILPADLDAELARVLREVNFIENEAIGQWHALPPVTRVGNPPVIQNNGVAAIEILGKLMNFDKNISRIRVHLQLRWYPVKGVVRRYLLGLSGEPGLSWQYSECAALKALLFRCEEVILAPLA